MTKEELKQEAEEWLCNNLHSASEEYFIKAMVDIAEPREKRIAELEATNKRISSECHNLVNSLEKKQKEVAELERENAELKKACDETQELLDKQIEATYKLDKENAELKETVTKMNNVITETFSNLTKAKELLERLLITSCNSDVLNLLPNCSEVLRVRVEAEQFLKDSEVEK